MSGAAEREAVYLEYRDKVARYINGKVSRAADAEELVSEVFLKVYEKFDSFDGTRASISTWIYTITRNTVIDYYRTKKEICSFDEAFMTEEDAAAPDEEMLERLAEALEELDERTRNIIILKYYSHLTLKVIAERVGLSYSHTKALHAQGLEALKGMLT